MKNPEVYDPHSNFINLSGDELLKILKETERLPAKFFLMGLIDFPDIYEISGDNYAASIIYHQLICSICGYMGNKTLLINPIDFNFPLLKRIARGCKTDVSEVIKNVYFHYPQSETELESFVNLYGDITSAHLYRLIKKYSIKLLIINKIEPLITQKDIIFDRLMRIALYFNFFTIILTEEPINTGLIKYRIEITPTDRPNIYCVSKFEGSKIKKSKNNKPINEGMDEILIKVNSRGIQTLEDEVKS